MYQDDDSKMTRRTAIKGIGTVGTAAALGGAGVLASSGSAAASSSSLTASNGTVKNDTGNVSEVFVVPKVATAWENFDEKPQKLRYILEAGIEGTGFKPVYRETPWLMDENGNPTHGTTDRVPESGRAHLLTRNSDFYEMSNDEPAGTPKIVLYKEGMENYYDEAGDYPKEAHFTGASLGNDSGSYANGNYGVLGDTSELDQPTDGSSKTTKVHLRLTSVLLTEDSDTVMADEYGSYKDGGYTYDWLQNNADSHPAINVAKTAFVVNTVNEQSSSSTAGQANTGMN